MTQTVWGDDICPVRSDREGGKKKEASERWAPERRKNIKLQVNRELGMGGETYGLSQR